MIVCSSAIFEAYLMPSVCYEISYSMWSEHVWYFENSCNEGCVKNSF
jgi:hypothetical protein